MKHQLKELLGTVGDSGRVTFITGAGISAESGIPTFRGEEGYWTVGSKAYRPEELATFEAFQAMPEEVWRWYLYRRTVCVRAGPNDSHLALADLEEALKARFSLITQNVDGLHLRAGSSSARTFQVHGNIDAMRSTDTSDRGIYPIPEEIGEFDRETPMTPELFALLRAPSGVKARPHILWFDEYYEEDLYHSSRAMEAASDCDLLVVIGTSGAASLPMHAVSAAAERGTAIIDINPQVENPFAVFASDYSRGLSLTGTAGEWLPLLVEALR